MSNEQISRVHYFERQFLRAEDFSDEQTYHLAMRRRHNIGQHTWGIISGLELVLDSMGNPIVQAGMAIDGYGRELILTEQQPLPLNIFVDKDSDQLDVWLEYDRFGSEAIEGYGDCGTDSDPLPYRYEEKPLLRLTVPDPARADRRKPEAVAEGDLDFSPSRLPPDDPQRDWPVFLGQVERTRPKPDKDLYTYSFDLNGRPYAGLVGGAVSSPSGRARVQIGAEKETDPYRFAVFLPGLDPNQDDEAKLGIDNAGNLEIHGKTNLHGDLTLKNGAVEFNVDTTVDAASSQGEEDAAPWTIHRFIQNNGDNPATHQLRIEMGTRENANNEVVIGTWSDEEKTFIPCLTVSDKCHVIVHGNLVVKGCIEGKIEEQQKRAKRPTGITAKSAETAAMLSAMPSAAGPINEFLFYNLTKAYLPLGLMSSFSRKALLNEMHKSGTLKMLLEEIKDIPELKKMVMEIIVSPIT